MNPSCRVYYEQSTKCYNVYLCEVTTTRCQTDKGAGIFIQIPESLAQELSLKFDYEKDINAMSQEQANAEMLSPNERNKHNDY